MKISILLLMFPFASCVVTDRPLAEKRADNNDKYKIYYLFEHDGCKVYRFYDMGNYVYFTNCQGETISKQDSTGQIRVFNNRGLAAAKQPVNHQKENDSTKAATAPFPGGVSGN